MNKSSNNDNNNNYKGLLIDYWDKYFGKASSFYINLISDESLIEKVAKSIAKAEHGNDLKWKDYWSTAIAAIKTLEKYQNQNEY